jgi:hypothetical protein
VDKLNGRKLEIEEWHEGKKRTIGEGKSKNKNSTTIIKHIGRMNPAKIRKGFRMNENPHKNVVVQKPKEEIRNQKWYAWIA